uniref:(California timema) hypothetical protein n=1 Tax=Timema californicum TaxID=61474 RepID=A0A7R9JBT2_TIMCA|nr:unnamed protein product [Timema californicum]
MLLFSCVTLHGTALTIKSGPPTVVAELWSHEKFGLSECLGRALIKPWVKLSQEQAGTQPLLTSYPLTRGGHVSGHLLTMVQMVEITGKPKCQGETNDEIVSGSTAKIPEYIKPKIVSYRMEVLFWGVRDMKKVQLRDVSRPNVSVECSGSKVSSPIIEDAARNANFNPPVDFTDLMLPDQPSLYPSMTIKAQDHRFFGLSPHVGAHVIHSIRPFLCALITDREFKERQTAIAFPRFPPPDNLEEDMVVKSKDEDESLPLLRDAGVERKEPPVLLSKLQSILRRKKGTQEISQKQSKETVSKEHREEEIVDDGTDKGDVEATDDIDEGDGTVKAKMKWRLRKVKRWGEGESFDEDEENLDWWSKYFRTLEAMEVTAEREKPEGKPKDEKINLLWKKSRDLKPKFVRRTKHKKMIKIYPNDLEAQSEFSGFSDRLTTFNLYRGTQAEDQISKGNIAGKFKGAIKIYRWPPPENKNLVTECGLNAERGLFQNYPGNKPLTVKVRVYVIRASGLPVMDVTGRSDPYLVVGTSSKNTIKDRDSYVARSLDPTFGKLFELKATFPLDYQLTVTVMDYDKYSSDDLIGETKIDLENRWYSKHRAVCGISDIYEREGYRKWRDSQTPSQILENLCREYKVQGPTYLEDCVVVGHWERNHPAESQTGPDEQKKEELALMALSRWQEVPLVGFKLVPEHVETRTLYHPDKPGIEQSFLWFHALIHTITLNTSHRAWKEPPRKICTISTFEPPLGNGTSVLANLATTGLRMI